MTLFRSPKLLAALLTLAVGSFVGASTAQAQNDGASTRTLVEPTVKEYGRPGYPQMTIYVWGNADAGVWNVEKGTDLLEFASVVSRIRMTQNSPERRRIETLTIYRNQSPDSDDPFFKARIESLFANRNSYPSLQGGDILVIETRTENRFTWRDITQVTGTVAALLNTYLLFDRLNR